MTYLYIIDGSNVSRSGNSQQVDLRTLYAILIEILKNGNNFACFFDANFPYLVPEPIQPKVRALSKNYPEHFYFVSAATRADDSILGYVDTILKNPEKYKDQEVRIISRDTFASEREYTEQYPWLADLRKYVISVNRFQDVISISHESLKLNIDLDPKKKIKAYADELFALLPEPTRPANPKPKKTRTVPAPNSKTEPVPIPKNPAFDQFNKNIASINDDTSLTIDVEDSILAQVRQAFRS